MATVDIINYALARANRPRITSLAESTETAAFASVIYPNIYKEVQSKGPWGCLLKRATLVENATAPTYEYANAFDLPTNFLKLVQYQEGDNSYDDFKIEATSAGVKLLTDDTIVKITYIEYSTTDSSWDAFLTEAIVTRLAAEFATNAANYQLRQILMAEYRLALQDGLASSNQQRSLLNIYSTDITTIRDT